VLVADLSCLNRNVADQSLVAAMLKNLGIELESVDEPDVPPLAVPILV